MTSLTLFNSIPEQRRALNNTFGRGLGHLGRARRSRTAIAVLVVSVILVGLLLRGTGDVGATCE